MIKYKLLNCTNEKDVLFDVCIPCWEQSDKLKKTLDALLDGHRKLSLPCKLIISIEKQSVVKNRLDCLTVSKSPYVLWMDDDVIPVTEGWDKYLYNKIVNEPKTGVIGINIVHWKAPDNRPTRTSGEVPDVCGAVMMTRKVPGVEFDVNYIRSQIEDTDACWQYRKAGYKVIQDNNLWCLHYNGEVNRDYDHNGPYFDKKWNVNLFSNRY